MNLVNRMLHGFVVFAALMLICISLSADWLFERGALADRFHDCLTLLEAQSKHKQLAMEARSAFERIEVKSRIAEALRNGEMALIDAAAYYRSLHEDPKSWRCLFYSRPEPTDAEGWCRVVIDWTVRNSNGQHPPSQVESLQQRLEAELQDLLKSHGTLTLPQ
jgi:hypothetical protein